MAYREGEEMKKTYALGVMVTAFFMVSCAGTRGSPGQSVKYPFPEQEVQWIRDGQPLVFEEEKWYPEDVIEILADGEVLQVGEFRSVQIFIEKTDVRPYNRLYTKFGASQFRLFHKKATHD